MASRDPGSPVNREELLRAVADLTDMGSTDGAERVTEATLRTLGEHVTAGEADDLAEGLPEDLAMAVTDRSDESPSGFSVEAFVGRVAERVCSDDDEHAEVTRHIRAVFAALAEHGLENELQEAREQLPNEYASLFEREGLPTDTG